MISLQRIRSLGIDWTLSALNWISESSLLAEADHEDYSRPISLRNRLGYRIEYQLSSLFSFFWSGSDEEIMSALNGETPRRYMTERQRKFAQAAIRDELKWTSFFNEFFCADCDEALIETDEAKLCADCRALHPEMLLEDRK